MRKLLTLLFTFSGLTVASIGYAANGAIDLTWGATCTPIVQNITPTNVATSMIASELGNDQTHNAYQVRALIGSATRTIPDAWRFDAAGCQGTSFIQLNHLPPAAASKACPAFQGAANTSFQLKDYHFVNPGSIYDQTIVRFYLANTYPAGFTTLAAQRYFLMQAIFDHTFSVNGATTPGTDCGGFETPMCIALLQGDRRPEESGTSSYIKLADGLEYFFDNSPNSFLTVHGIAGCPAVPTHNATWGQIKSQYRN